MQFIVHRGYGAQKFCKEGEFENSLNSFKKCFNSKEIFAAETDVRYTKDKVIVCHHDPDINNIPLKDLTFEEVLKLKPFVVKFEELIKVFPTQNFVIELKAGEDNESILKEVFEKFVLKDKNPDRFIFISFCLKYLLIVKELRKESYCSWIVSSRRYDPNRYQLFLKKKDIEMCFRNGIEEISGHYISFTRNKIRSIHEKGMKVGIGPVNSRRILKYTEVLGADKIYTDRVESLLRFFS